MKGIFKCFGVLLALPIIFGLSLSVFSDANALDVSINVTATGRSWTPSSVRCTYTNGLTVTNNADYCGSFHPSDSTSALSRISSGARLEDVKNGYYYRGFIALKGQLVEPEVLWRLQNPGNPWRLVEFHAVTNEELIEYTQRVSDSTGRPCENGVYIGEVCEYNYSPTFTKFYEVTLYSNSDGSSYWFFGNGTSNIFYNSPEFNLSTQPTIHLYSILELAPSAEQQMNDKDNEDRSNIESQSSDIDSDSGDSQEEAESTGTTLLGAFTAFVSAITNAQPSNCNIDMDLGNLDLGVVNLCQLSPPAGFSTLASIFLIIFCVPLSIATARKVISLFRSFQ